jgi:hypothetical protein
MRNLRDQHQNHQETGDNTQGGNFLGHKISAPYKLEKSSTGSTKHHDGIGKFPAQSLLCCQQNLRLSGASPALPIIKKPLYIFAQINIVGVAGSRGSGSKFIVASINCIILQTQGNCKSLFGKFFGKYQVREDVFSKTYRFNDALIYFCEGIMIIAHI